MPSKKILELIISDKHSTAEEVNAAQAQLAGLDTTDVLADFLRYAEVTDIKEIPRFEDVVYRFGKERKLSVELETQLWIAHGTEKAHAQSLCSFNRFMIEKLERRKQEGE
jgi:hypothetical protein